MSRGRGRDTDRSGSVRRPFAVVVAVVVGGEDDVAAVVCGESAVVDVVGEILGPDWASSRCDFATG